jgi:RNA polymerase sigma-70 factor (ECF subfamily)
VDLTLAHERRPDGTPPDDPPSDVRQAIAILQAHASGPEQPFGDGERWALGTLYERYFGLAWTTAARLLASDAEVEDVVEDVFVRLPATLQRYRPGNFPAWLHRVVHSAALMRLRSNERQREDDLDGRPEIATDEVAEADLIALEDATAVRRALDRLPAALRAVVMLRVYDEHSHRAIAALLGITEGASEVRYSRALRRLRELLRDDVSH